MIEKILNARIVHKNDIEFNWHDTNFVPKNGELIIYNPDDEYEFSRVKIGDGITDISELPFITDDIQETIKATITTHASNNDIHVTAEEKEAWSNIEIPSLEGYATESYVTNLYQKLNSNTVLGFYCIEDVTVITNGISKVYPANSNIEITFIEDDEWEIVPTSNNSILTLNAYPGALGVFYPWLEGVKQFSNILFDMNDEAMYSKWSQGNQGMYQVQFAQYSNCIFWSDNPFISEVTRRTNYTLYYTSQLPLCYSTIPDNTFKAFFLAFQVNSDPNWGNKAYRDSFAKATWATQAFSYYGARTVGIFGHDSEDFNIVLPKDCRGLMYAATAIENAGTFDAINTTNFGAKSGSWREAFGECSSLRNLYIKNLKVNLNISWSPINYDSIYFIIANAANTNAITISISPYTYNLLSDADFELATNKNITIESLTTNYIEDKRLSEIANKADKTYVDEQVAGLVDSAPDTLNTIGELAIAFQENKEVVDILNEAIVVKADKTYVDEAIANIPIESDVFIIDCPDGSTISHTFEQIMAAVNSDKAVYASMYGTILAPLNYIADDNSYIDFYAITTRIDENQNTTIQTNSLRINNNNTFVIKTTNLLSADDAYTKFESKKDRDLIVTYAEGSTFGVTHSAQEIYEAVQNGTTVYFQRDTELLNLMEITQDYATFFMFYMSMEGKPQQKVVVISGNSIMLDQDDTYNYATVTQLNNKADKTALNSYYNKTEVDNLLSTKAEDSVKKYFLIVETVKQNNNYLLDGITFDEIYEKFNIGNVNMVCHVDGTDYIPLLSVTPNKIMFSGIYQTTSVSLDFDTNGVGTLTSNSLINQNRIQNYYTKNEMDTKIADLVNSAYDALILKSSTSGSTKKFKLTIDDDGILSTEEVTE